MPCYDSRDDASCINRETVERLDNATRLLCMACREMDESKMDPEIRQWWLAHKKDDDRRITKQNAKVEIVKLEESVRQINKELYRYRCERDTLSRLDDVTTDVGDSIVNLSIDISANESKVKRFMDELAELKKI